MKFAPQEDREHQRFMLNTELDRALTDQTRRNGIGWQTREQWQTFHDTLLQHEGIEKPVDVAAAFSGWVLAPGVPGRGSRQALELLNYE